MAKERETCRRVRRKKNLLEKSTIPILSGKASAVFFGAWLAADKAALPTAVTVYLEGDTLPHEPDTMAQRVSPSINRETE